MKAFLEALKQLPDSPAEKKDEPAGDGKIKIEFYDVDDPSELDNPEEPTEDDREKYREIGDPAELVPGEDVPVPDVPKKDGFEFIQFNPDPEDMDESGKTYATYMSEDEEDKAEDGE